ncbi:peptidylprolyl cis-trans isomerase, FKBP-type domain containing protein [Acanthamoeba castellanii str. Neff]|uniref:peptidylprolyl isomerase n=1 Tax=Acanthamoeba castellanii (strain ATCC 30010 / Neff) TaxID=1257118 RepID=L8GFP0_ACACF|nr:peptidylprolyl cis-trans isomerase, FKBP-type domain containing protein [Acanthamoeba castellanii str. Neff]ELR11659.1 peptidylprolyl cis-trans isomerase, FKBP-type domain containing protein [Acanthamoeba castellanii str. Neff]
MEHLLQQQQAQQTCAVCQVSSREKELKRCAACQAVWYCDAEHQKQHWKTHKAICKLIPEAHRNGFAKKVLKEGNNERFPKRGNTVKVHYTGTLLNDKQFDSSREKGRPFVFVIGKKNVIKGWDEGVLTMSVGERSLFVISPEWAYGESGIEPVATLVFDVELLEV